MKFFLLFASTSIPILVSSCSPVQQQANAGSDAVFQDPNNPYAVPGVTTQGGGYAPAAQAPYQPIPTASINPPASIPSYTPPAVASSPSVSSASGGNHVVSSGDTLWGLSRQYSVSVDSIRQANGISGDTIVTGQTLVIPN